MYVRPIKERKNAEVKLLHSGANKPIKVAINTMVIFKGLFFKVDKKMKEAMNIAGRNHMALPVRCIIDNK